MRIQSINPATGKMIRTFNSASKSEVLSAIKRAKVAQKAWSARPKSDRIKIIKNLKKVLEDNKDVILDLIHKEAGYPPKDTEGVFYDVMDGFDYYCGRYQKLKNIDFPVDPEVMPKTTAEVQFIPHGVIGHIGIWNYPFWQTMITAIPGLLTGNAIVYKPSEYVTMMGLKIAELIHKAGVPKDVYIPIIGAAEVGKLIVRSDVDALVFTGGIDTGDWIAKNAGIKPMILELSGNDAALVLKDCNMRQAVEGVAFGTFSHSGQVCTRIKRVYVVKEIANEFISKLVEFSKKVETTPMIRDDARKKVHSTVQDAVINGAKLLLGGKLPNKSGFWYPATIVLVNNDNLKVIKQETFGPVCSIRVVKDEQEAIRLANNSPYGLGGGIWCKNFKRAQKLAEQMNTGTIWINDANMPLVCGEYTQGCKVSSIPNSQERLMMFLKKRNIISYNSQDNREWWY